MGTNLARTNGVMEGHIAPRSGVRSGNFTLHLLSAQTYVCNARPIGGASSAAVTAWTALTINNDAVPFGATLVAQVVQASATTGTLRLRVRGYDMFGQYQEEITPTVNLVAKTNNFVYLAKVFSFVTEVAYQSTGMDIAGDTLSLGMRWDWTRTNDATNEHIAGRNLGIPVPMRLAFQPGGAVSPTTKRLASPLGGKPKLNMGSVPYTSPVFGDDFVQQWDGYAKAYFNGFTSQPANLETITIDGKVYTFKTTLTSADGDVQIGADTTATSSNLKAAILATPAGAGSQFGASTTRHPTVDILLGGGGLFGIRARQPGARGNLITLAEAVGGTNAWFAANLQGGYDWPHEVVGLTVMDMTGLALAGAVTNHNPGEYAIGWSEAGWSGSVEKLHFLRQSSVAQWATTDNIMVRMSVRSMETTRT